MSELLNTRNDERGLRLRLLMGVSATALLLSACAVQSAQAADGNDDRPTVWIELGGQLEQQMGQGGEAFAPPFIVNNPNSAAYKLGSPLQAEKLPLFSNGLEGTILFEPAGTDWVFSGSIRYGRSNGRKDVNRSTPGRHFKEEYPASGRVPRPSGYGYYYTHHCCRAVYGSQRLHAFAGAQVAQDQAHAVVDFQAGKDVGLGLFGRSGTSVVSAGVRFAQFESKADVTLRAQPNVSLVKAGYSPYVFYLTVFPLHSYVASIHNARSFHGIGPSISWNGSTPLVGNPQGGGIALDWGANAAILFGRQRASGSHQTYGYTDVEFAGHGGHYLHTGSFSRSRTVVVPNAGGFAGVSFLYSNAKVSFGYRGDFFFGAMDAGNDMRTTKTVGFYGPFATISVGLGG